MISGHDHCFVRVIITPIIIVANTIIMILFQSVGKSLTFRGTVFEASRFSISSISFRQYWIYFSQAIFNFLNQLKFSIFNQASHLIKLHKCADPVCDTQLLRVTWSFQHSPCRLLYLTILMTYSSSCVNGIYSVSCYWNCETVKTEGVL